MDRGYYIGKINSYENMLEDTMSQTLQKERELQDAEEFQIRHQQAVDEMEEHFFGRKQRIEETSLDASKIHIFSGYKDCMLELLEGREKQQYVWQKEEEQVGIRQVIRELENEIRTLRSQRYGYEHMIADLYHQLNTIEE